MSKETAAAILTQAYFQSSPTAAKRLNGQVAAGVSKGAAPESGAIALLASTYKQILEAIDK